MNNSCCVEGLCSFKRSKSFFPLAKGLLANWLVLFSDFVIFSPTMTRLHILTKHFSIIFC